MQRVAGIILLVAAMVLAPAPAPAQTGGFSAFGGASSAGAGGNSSVGLIASLDFVDTPITSVFRMICDLTDWSIIMSPEVSSRPPKINLWIRNLSPEETMARVIAISGLISQREGKVFHVMTFDEYSTLQGLDKRVVYLEHASAEDVVRLLTPYVDKASQGRILPYNAGNAVVLLAPETQMDSLNRLIKIIDSPSQYDLDELKLIKLVHRDVTQMEEKLRTFFTESSSTSENRSSEAARSSTEAAVASGQRVMRAGGAYNVKFMTEPSLNVLVIRGAVADLEQVAAIIAALDTPSELTAVNYTLRYTQADQLFQTLETLLEDSDLLPGDSGDSGENDNPRRFRLALSEQNNSIIVEADATAHRRIAEIIGAIDRPLGPGSGIIRLYRLENTTADAVAGILQSLIDEEEKAAQDGSSAATASGNAGAVGAGAGATAAPTATAASAGNLDLPKIVAAAEINAVVIKASFDEHAQFAETIERLDSTKDQVLIEVTLVLLQDSDNFSFGLEAGGNVSINNHRVNMVGFSNFGIGEIDSATGLMNIAQQAPLGLNYAVMNADDFSLVLNALKTVGNVRIVSCPKLVTEDNTQGNISQTNREPYEVISQGEVSDQSSFGGYVEAGTTLTVVPHISEKDWLRLEYQIRLSSFGTNVKGNLPPPIFENTITGIARLPADHMIVLGGMTGDWDFKDQTRIPFLGAIPLLGELFKSRSHNNQKTTLYVFVRPRILRDESLADMVRFSASDVRAALTDPLDLPVNPMMWLPEDREEQTEEEMQ